MTAQKKYQVFISSTFTDMKAERQAAVEAVLTAGHIPAGMELFSAGDESQLEVIKRWIQESDIYLLILGGRYGSLETASRLSYTEIEYDYAVQNKKPLFALVLTESAIAAKKIPADRPEFLRKFREKVLSKMSVFVEDAKDIKFRLPQAIHDLEGRLEGRRILAGWIRGNAVQNSVLSRILMLSAIGCLAVLSVFGLYGWSYTNEQLARQGQFLTLENGSLKKAWTLFRAIIGV